jgi:hypothetical protein
VRALALAALLLAAAPAGARPRCVLFVGNSYVSVNDLPRAFARVAASLGSSVIFDAVAPGGYTLAQHAADPATRAKLASRRWDVVVLQEQSQHLGFRADQVARETAPAAERLSALAKASGARVVLEETWGRRDGDAYNCRNLPEVCTYDGMQDRLNANTAALAESLGAILAPIGAAWRGVRRAHPEINLYGPDANHPSPAGTYLAACVLYAAISRRTPVGAHAQGLVPGSAAVLRRAALPAVGGGPAAATAAEK